MIKIEIDEIVKQFGDSPAMTFPAVNGFDEESGWTIEGEIFHDYVFWINDFKAHHPVLGRVYGNYEQEIVASSREAYDHFVKHHPPDLWDYADI